MPGQRVSVWVVDDDHLSRLMVDVALRRDGGFEVLGSTASAEPLLAHLAAGLRPPQVVVADLHMSGTSGVGLAGRLPEGGPAVLHVSADVLPQTSVAVLLGGARGLVSKPVYAPLLVPAIRAVAAGGVVFTGLHAKALLTALDQAAPPRESTASPGGPADPATAPDEGGGALGAALVEELRAADDLARLLAGVAFDTAHEANALHAAILGLAEVLAEDLGGSATDAPLEGLDEIRRTAARLADVNRRLARWSMPPHIRSQRVTAGSQAVGCDLRVAAADGARWHFGLPDRDVRQRSPTPLPVEMDLGRAHNLVWAAVRAVAAVAPGGRVVVEARAVPSARSLVDDPRYGRVRVSAELGGGAKAPEAFPRWSPPFVASQLRPGDAAFVMAGAWDGEAVVDIWMPLVEP